MTLPRPKMASLALSLATASYLLVLLNSSFWSKTFTILSHAPRECIVIAIAYSALVVSLCALTSIPYLIKPALILFISLSATCAYFADTFAVQMTADIVRDVFTTTSMEADSYVSGPFVLQIGALGVLPSLLVAWVRVRHRPVLRQLGRNMALVCASLAAATIVVALDHVRLAPALDARRILLHTSNPIGPLAATFEFASQTLKRNNGILSPLGTDATRDPMPAGPRLPLVTVLVVGEAARAQNFGLDGYSRDTSPELRAAGVVNYPHATSCGTETATSVPCMFSPFGRAGYSTLKVAWTETLLDVLNHAGIPSLWWDNDGGSKGVADRVDYRVVTVGDAKNCADGDCRDQALVDHLVEALDAVKQDSVIVLHLRGSHGPSYHLRYPPEFGHFKPECQTAHLTDCSSEEIVNAYDNTLLYTDHLLGEVIDNLTSRRDRMMSAMVYMSDHGESLGEGGIYLHGTPYAYAPPQQTHIPFAIWVGDSFADFAGIDVPCLKAHADEPVSQDNFFHSVLGLMKVATSVRKPELDLFAACSKAGT